MKNIELDNIEKLVCLVEQASVDIAPTYKQWYRLGFALSNELGEIGRSYYHRLCRFYPRYNEQETNMRFNRCLKSKKGGITISTLFYLAKEAGISINQCSDKSYLENKKQSVHIPKPAPEPQPDIEYMRWETVEQIMQQYENNVFIQWLSGIVGGELTDLAIEMYKIGTAKDGGTLFPHIDLENNVCSIKKILFKKDGHREDNGKGYDWKHPENWKRIFFGEHLLIDKKKTVAIVEAEKTAIIGNMCVPEFIWLSPSGKNGMTKEKCHCLHGRNVILFPDAGCANEWREIAEKLQLKRICNYYVSLIIENEEKGLDVADFLIGEMPKPNVPKSTTPTKTSVAVLTLQPTIKTQQPTIESATAQEIKQDKQLNDEDFSNKKKTATLENEINELADYFSNYFSTMDLPDEPMTLNALTEIIDPHYFVESNLKCLRANSNNMAYLPYLERLQEFKTYLEELKPQLFTK